MRARIPCLGIGLCLVFALTGCAKQSNETAETTAGDSLLASNPVEAPSGSLEPQLPYDAPGRLPERARAKPSQRTSTMPKSTSPGEPQPPVDSDPAAVSSGRPTGHEAPAVNVEWGSFLHVTFADRISSETAHPGDAWNGTLGQPVMVRDHEAFPAGSSVHGTVKSAKPAQVGDRAMLTLVITSIDVDGQSWPVSAAADPIIADSPRARNVGAIVGSAAAGALIGKTAGGGKGSVIGGLLGGAAAGGAVARSKGFQAVVEPGARLTFTVSQDVIVRR